MIRLALRVRREQAELALAELLGLAPAGVEEVDIDADTVEYAVYGAPGELPSLPAVRAVAGTALVEIATTEVADDWAERWRQFHQPVLIAPPVDAPRRTPALLVQPPWLTGQPLPADDGAVREIVIDPGQAFGTGAHATTRLCLELLLELAGRDLPQGALLDIGSGSGVLSIAAAALGWAPVTALDNETESVTASAENARRNGVAIRTARFDLRHDALPALRGDGAPQVVVANLLRPLLLALAAAMPAAPPDLLISGLLVAEVDEVVGAFAHLGLRERRRLTQGEWAAAWLGER